METAISWGRYAELFDFDAARRRFIRAERQAETPETPVDKVEDPDAEIDE